MSFTLIPPLPPSICTALSWSVRDRPGHQFDRDRVAQVEVRPVADTLGLDRLQLEARLCGHLAESDPALLQQLGDVVQILTGRIDEDLDLAAPLGLDAAARERLAVGAGGLHDLRRTGLVDEHRVRAVVGQVDLVLGLGIRETARHLERVPVDLDRPVGGAGVQWGRDAALGGEEPDPCAGLGHVALGDRDRVRAAR